jgi:hypothetical protein
MHPSHFCSQIWVICNSLAISQRRVPAGGEHVQRGVHSLTPSVGNAARRPGANAYFIHINAEKRVCVCASEWPAALVSLSPARKMYVSRMQRAVAQHIRRRRAVCMYAKRGKEQEREREREKRRRQPFICCLPKWFGPSFSFLHHMLTLRKPLAGWLAAFSLLGLAASLWCNRRLLATCHPTLKSGS